MDDARYKHRELRTRARDAGVFDRRPFAYAVWMSGAALIFAVGYAGFLAHAQGWYRLACAILCAMGAIQGGFIAHDAGHFAITQNARLIRLIGLVGMTIPGGQAFAHWRWKHHAHHTKPNTPGADHDIDVYLFAIHDGALPEKDSFSRRTTSVQSWLMFLLGPLQSIGIRLDSLGFVFKRLKTSKLDLLCLLVHLAVWLVVPAVLYGVSYACVSYLMTTLIMGFYLNYVFWWNHIGTRIVPEGEELDFVELQVSTARDLRVGWFGHILTGGLAAQIEHHLFPTAPMMNLPKVRPIVKAHCEDVGLVYSEVTFPAAIAGVWHDLRSTSRKLTHPDAAESVAVIDKRAA